MNTDKIAKTLPPIFVGMGMAFGGAATISGIRATFDICDDGYNSYYFKDKGVSKKDKVKTVGRYYWKTGMATMAAAGCFMCAVRGYSTQLAGMAATASYFEKRFLEYREKNRELYGDENDRNVENAVVKDHISKNPPPKKKREDAFTIWDPVSEQYFEATQKELDHCERDMNRILAKEGPVQYWYLLKHFKGVIWDLPICHDIGWFLDDTYYDYHYYNESFFARQLFEIQLDPQETIYGDIYVLRCSIEPMLNVELDADVTKDSQELHCL